jgi:pimeloyl-ACP methyl ester carboxylesterase
VHGLFGSSANWQGIARRLGDDRRILMPDLRNHGSSPRDHRMDYPSMAADLGRLLDDLGVGRAHLVGHSMGGKAAMWLALTQPDRVASLVVADIAPVTYPARLEALLEALTSLPLDEIRDRSDAHARLAPRIPQTPVRDYLLQNLAREHGGPWRWRVNLPVIASSMGTILGFPDADGRQFAGTALFVYGSTSSYLAADHLPRIRELFPLARLRAIPNAGHWVYADQPDAFVAAVSGALRD